MSIIKAFANIFTMDKIQLDQLFEAFEALIDERIYAKCKFDGSAMSSSMAAKLHTQSRAEKELCYRLLGLSDDY